MFQGLDIVRAHSEEHGLEAPFARYCNYVERFWLNEVGVEVLAIGDLESRTNNAVENFYLQLWKKLQYDKHPNTWKFVSKYFKTSF